MFFEKKAIESGVLFLIKALKNFLYTEKNHFYGIQWFMYWHLLQLYLLLLFF